MGGTYISFCLFPAFLDPLPIQNYTQCSCVYSDIEYRHNGFDLSGANVGRCHQPCHSIYVFLLIFAIAVFAGCCAQSPVLVITLG